VAHDTPMAIRGLEIGMSDQKLGDLGLDRGKIVVTALRREGIVGREPDATTRLREGDVLVLWGAPDDLERGENRLLMG